MAEVHAPLPEARGSWAPCILYRPAHWWGSFSEMTFPRFPCFHRSHQSSATIHPFCCHAAPRLGSLHGRRQLVGAPGGGGRPHLLPSKPEPLRFGAPDAALSRLVLQ